MKKPWVSSSVSSLPLVLAKEQPHLPSDDFDEMTQTHGLKTGKNI